MGYWIRRGHFCEERKYIEQYSHEPNRATRRFWITHKVEITEEQRLALETRRKLGYDALGVMEGHLNDLAFFLGTATRSRTFPSAPTPTSSATWVVSTPPASRRSAPGWSALRSNPTTSL
jgi:hypothetical protein